MPDDSEMCVRAFQQMLDLWIAPEVARRQERGECPKPLNLRAAQVIFFADGRPHQVRINDEVSAMAAVRLKPGVPNTKGDRIRASDIDEIDCVQLGDDVDPDCGHITAVLIGEHWRLFFDCRYNKAWAARHISAAKEFLDAAQHAKSNHQWRSFVDNAFSAAELAAKALVLSAPVPGTKAISTHRAVHTGFNRLSRYGNVEARHRDAFNELAALREKARYPEREEFTLGAVAAEKYLLGLRGLIAEAEAWFNNPSRPTRG